MFRLHQIYLNNPILIDTKRNKIQLTLYDKNSLKPTSIKPYIRSKNISMYALNEWFNLDMPESIPLQKTSFLNDKYKNIPIRFNNAELRNIKPHKINRRISRDISRYLGKDVSRYNDY